MNTQEQPPILVELTSKKYKKKLAISYIALIIGISMIVFSIGILTVFQSCMISLIGILLGMAISGFAIILMIYTKSKIWWNHQ